MHHRRSLLTIGALCALTVHALAQLAGYTPPTGFRAFSLELPGGVVAVSPSGKLAVARSQFGGGATITVYDRILPEGRQVLAQISSSQWQFFGGMTWRDENTLLFSENGDLDTVLRWNLNDNAVDLLAPVGSLPNVADVALAGDQLLALGADGPNSNRIYAVHAGMASVLYDAYGTGYAGGLVFRSGVLYAGDTNDPNFTGNPGQVFRFQPVYDGSGLITSLLLGDVISLEGGNGAGISGLAVDSEGDLIATTQRTLTRMRGTVATPFGQFSGAFPFPTSLAYYGNGFEPFAGEGILIVDGSFTAVGGLFAVTPVPEPSSLLLLASGLVLLRRFRRGAL
ncbi:MAG: PEP-CTERM sorting domain-containing protein [Fimbriimonadales bacterium]